MEVTTKKIQLTDEETKVLLSVISLVHPENETMTSVHMSRIISAVMSRWYECNVAWQRGYMDMDMSKVKINDLEEVTYREIVDSLVDNDLLIEARVPVCTDSKLTRRGYSLGRRSLKFLNKAA